MARTLRTDIGIDASKEKVWEILWNRDSYRAWTKAFSESSDVQTDNWKEGTKVIFGDNQGSGMVARVAANRPNEFMSFEHLGEVKDGVEDTESEKVKQWAGATENYSLSDEDGKTKLDVALDVDNANGGFKDYFLKTFPIALEKVKELAEKN